MTPKTLSNAKDLEKAFIKWNASIFGYIITRIRDEGASEDLVQEVFFKAWRSRETFDSSKSSLKTWLFTIAKNEIIDHFKSNKNKTVDIEKLEDKIIDHNSNTKKEIHDKTLNELIMSKLKFLNERDQDLIILRFKEDLSVKEISKILNLNYVASKVAIHRAIQKLTELCNKIDGNDVTF